jgi:D-arabinose 1-dehydrogenase-like Zn-dependent alcohol dehydrogenase
MVVARPEKQKISEKTSMKAMLLTGHGGPEMLRYGDAADPTIGPEEILIDVHAASVNAADYQLVAGFWRLPNLAVSRPCPRFSVGASESGKVQFSGGPEWLKLNAGKRFRRNWISWSLSNLSCRISPAAAAVLHRS